MARTGVSFFDISKAAVAITDQGYTPTVDRVREILGTGSKSTIAPLLKQWKEKHGETTDAGGLPQQLLEAVQNLYNTNQDLANERIQNITDECAEKIEQSRHRVMQVEAENSSLSQEVKQLKDQIESLTHDNQQLRDSSTSLAEQLKERNQTNRGLREKIERLEADKEELKLEIKTVRTHFEHYQQQMAEDRLLEREQHQSALQLSQQQAHTLSIHVDELKTGNASLLAALEKHREEVSNLTQLNGQLREANAAVNAQCTMRAEENQAMREKLQEEIDVKNKVLKELKSAEQVAAQNNLIITKLETSHQLTNEQLQSANEKLLLNETRTHELISLNAELHAEIKQLKAKSTPD